MMKLRWAVPRPEENQQWAALLAAMAAADGRGEVHAVEDLADEWRSVWSHPATDAIFVWDGPDLVGFAWLKAIPGDGDAHEVACWGGVGPTHRRRGVGTALMNWSRRRGNEIAATFDAASPTNLIIEVGQDQADLGALVRRAGFDPQRRFLEVARATSPVNAARSTGPVGLECVGWSPALDHRARLAHAEAFAHHGGRRPRNADQWVQWYTGHRSFRPDLSVLAVETATAAVVALVLTAAYPQDWDRGPVEAWITTVGTVPDRRREGVAGWLLDDVHRRLADSSTGFERSILGVDDENSTGAGALYGRLGYELVRSDTTWAHPAGD